jgi:hypothetical protein
LAHDERSTGRAIGVEVADYDNGALALIVIA